MKTSEENKNIIKALSKAQAEFKTVGKDRENPFANNSYATLDAILKEVLPKLNANNLFITQEPLTDHDDKTVRIGVMTKIFHESGEWIEYEPLFMILEKGAKMNMAQSAGSIITYAKRYAVSAIFGISTGDDNDGVQPDSRDNSKQNNYQQQPQQNNNQTQQRQQYEQQPLPPKMDELNHNINTAMNQIKKQGGDINIIRNQFLSAMGLENFEKYSKTDLLKFLEETLKDMNEHKQEQGNLFKGRTTQPAGPDWGQ